MADNTNEIPEITPLPTPPVGMPKVPITLFNVWTWSTPVIPSFYWNVYSAEQRIKQICKEIGRIEAYLDYAATTANEAHLDMIEHINEVEQKLSKQIADLTVRLTTEVNRLDALITAETAAREAGDEKLEAEIVKETTERKAADAKLTADLEKEVQDRQDADEGLHSEISTETTARIHADDVLHAEISAETAAREEADTATTASITQEVADRKAADDALGKRIDANSSEISKLDTSLATKLERNDLKASGKITLTPGEGNTITIGDTFEADFQALQSAIAGLNAALESETSERRYDDQQLQTAVDARLERGKLLAGDGIEVYNDPDESTVTVSAKLTEADLAAVEAKADEAKETADQAKATAEGKLSTVSVGDGLTGDGTTGSPVTLTYATADTIGGIKVGEGLGVGFDGRLSVDPLDEVFAVVHDRTLTGSGLHQDPLSVATASQGALTNRGGVGGLAVNTGDGLSISDDNKLVAAPATTSTIGGVKVGEGLTVTADGTLSATGQGGSGLAEVAHDSTLNGDGTSGSPLGVVAAPRGAITAGEQGLAVTVGAGLRISNDNKLAADVTQAKLSAVEGKADAAQAAATQAGSKAEAASTAATEADTKAEAAQTAATQAGSKAEAAQTAADEAKAAADGKLSTVAVSGPLTGDGTTGSPLDVSAATATSAGVITEDRVKELAGSASITAENPLKVKDGKISLSLDSPLSVSDTGHLQVEKVTTDGGHADSYGVVSPNVIRSLNPVSEPLYRDNNGTISLQLDYPLSVSSTGQLQVAKMPTDGGHTDSYGVVSQNVINALIEAKVSEMVKAEALNS